MAYRQLEYDIGIKEKSSHQRPVTIHSVKVSVANTTVLDVDKNLIRARLLDGNLLVLDGSTGLVNDLRPLLLGNFRHVDDVRVSRIDWRL